MTTLTTETRPATAPEAGYLAEIAEIKSALTIEQAMEMTGHCRRTFENWIARGLPVIRIPGKHSRVKIRLRVLADVMAGRVPLNPMPGTKAAAVKGAAQ
jgi:hypothetical protein